jgi:hypothetical protein
MWSIIWIKYIIFSINLKNNFYLWDLRKRSIIFVSLATFSSIVYHFINTNTFEMVEIESQSKSNGDNVWTEGKGDGTEEKKKNENASIQCCKCMIISVYYFHLRVEIEKEIFKTNGPSWTICLTSPWKHQPYTWSISIHLTFIHFTLLLYIRLFWLLCILILF